jgi:hypothetical protein
MPTAYSPIPVSRRFDKALICREEKMRLFRKLMRPPCAPQSTLSSTDIAEAVDMLSAVTLAHHRLIGVALGHLLVLTPPERRRALVNTLYADAPLDAAPKNLNRGLAGKTFQEIGREADDIAATLIDALALAVGDAERDPRG